MGSLSDPMRPQTDFALVREDIKFASGKKNAALVVATTVLDHWDEASGFLSF